MSSILRSFNCKICARSFSSIRGLSAHARWHNKAYDVKPNTPFETTRPVYKDKTSEVQAVTTATTTENAHETINDAKSANAGAEGKDDKEKEINVNNNKEVEHVLGQQEEAERNTKKEQEQRGQREQQEQIEQKEQIGPIEQREQIEEKEKEPTSSIIFTAIPIGKVTNRYVIEEAECSSNKDSTQSDDDPETQSDKDFIDDSACDPEISYYHRMDNSKTPTPKKRKRIIIRSDSDSTDDDTKTRAVYETPKNRKKLFKKTKNSSTRSLKSLEEDTAKKNSNKAKTNSNNKSGIENGTRGNNEEMQEAQQVLDNLPPLPPSFVPCVNEASNNWPGFGLGNRIGTTHVLESYLSHYKTPKQRGKGKCFSGFMIRFVCLDDDQDEMEKAIALLIKYLNELKLRTKFLTGPLAQNHFVAVDTVTAAEAELLNFYIFFRLPQSIVPSTLSHRFKFENNVLKPCELYLLRAGTNLQQLLQEINYGTMNIEQYSAGSINAPANNSQLQIDLIKEFALRNGISDIVGLSQYRKFRNAPILNTETEDCDCGCGFSFATHKEHIANAKKLFLRNDEITVLKNVISSNGNVNSHELQKKCSEEIFFENIEKCFATIAEKKYYQCNKNNLGFYVIFWYIFGGRLSLEDNEFSLHGKENVRHQIENLLYHFFIRCVRGLHKRRALVFYGGFNSGKSTVSYCLSNLLPFECLDLNGEITKFSLGVASTKKLILVDDINLKGLKNLDQELRNALDGFTIQVERKFQEPKTGKAPPFLLTSNVCPDAFPVGLQHRLKSIHFQHKIPEALLAFFTEDFQRDSAEFLYFCMSVLDIAPEISFVKDFFHNVVRQKIQKALTSSTSDLNASLSEC